MEPSTVKKTSLSAGYLLKSILDEDPEVSARCRQIVPVFGEVNITPFIFYRRARLVNTAFKPDRTGRMCRCDDIVVEVLCCEEDYERSLELAEAVVNALDGEEYVWQDSLRMRNCILTDAEEYYEADCYFQELTFNLKIEEI